MAENSEKSMRNFNVNRGLWFLFRAFYAENSVPTVIEILQRAFTQWYVQLIGKVLLVLR